MWKTFFGIYGIFRRRPSVVAAAKLRQWTQVNRAEPSVYDPDGTAATYKAKWKTVSVGRDRAAKSRSSSSSSSLSIIARSTELIFAAAAAAE